LLQRFISEDPAGFSGGSTNIYENTLNNPVNLKDLTELYAEACPAFAFPISDPGRLNRCLDACQAWIRAIEKFCNSLKIQELNYSAGLIDGVRQHVKVSAMNFLGIGNKGYS
jgi:hypothetical protein